MKKACSLNKGDKVAIVSLSGGMLGEPFCNHDIELGRKRLSEFGLEMVIMPNALKGISYLKSHPEARAQDLKLAFSNVGVGEEVEVTIYRQQQFYDVIVVMGDLNNM